MLFDKLTNHIKNDNDKNAVPSMSCLMTMHGLMEFNKRRNDPYGKAKNDGPDNMVLSKNIKLGYDTVKSKRNTNVFVIGASGSGKTRSFIEPNILQYNTNFIITDPNGDLVQKHKQGLIDNGYTVKTVNVCDCANSNHYNPLHNINDDKDVFILTNALFDCPAFKGGDPYWDDMEKHLINAVILLIKHTYPKNQQNFKKALDLLRNADELEQKIEDLRNKSKNNLAVTMYDSFNTTKQTKNIIMSAATRLKIFALKGIAKITKDDNLELNTFADTKQAIFIVTPGCDNTFDALTQMLYTQLFVHLYKENNMCKQHVKFYLTPEINLESIPDFKLKMQTIRTSNISIAMIAKALGQLKSAYTKNWSDIVENCDSVLYMGGEDQETIEWLIKTQNKPKFRDRMIPDKNHMLNIMTEDKLACIGQKDCYILIRGERPYFGAKC